MIDENCETCGGEGVVPNCERCGTVRACPECNTVYFCAHGIEMAQPCEKCEAFALKEMDALRARVAGLEAELHAALLEKQDARRASAEAALKWAWVQGVQYDYPGTEQEWIDSGLRAVCGESTNNNSQHDAATNKE